MPFLLINYFRSMIYLLIVIAFFAVMLLYFRVADKYNIIDRPNERSSHTHVTIRGGGIIFLLAVLIGAIWYPQYWLPAAGTLLIGVISFIDDRISLPNKVRIIFHLAAVSILFISLQIFHLPAIWIALLYIIAVGIINAYNFMDGINGITGLYSLVVLGGFQWVNLRRFAFMEPDMIWLPMIACLVFLFFNFRKKARCFAGDVGSVTMAFWILFLLLTLTLRTHNGIYFLFLSVYGVDSVLTIIHRLLRRENIFQAHRLHFYQLMANECRIPHRIISALYAAIQGTIILFVVAFSSNWMIVSAICLLPLILAYVLLKPRLLR